MFPPQLPNVFIRWLTEPGDVVYDPFSGRGTVPLEALLAGRRAYASDANPLAAALSAAKVRIPASSRLRARITQLENRFAPASIDEVPDHIRMLYSEPTLRQLVFLKAELASTGMCSEPIRWLPLLERPGADAQSPKERRVRAYSISELATGQ